MPRNRTHSRPHHHHAGIMQKIMRLYGKALQTTGEKFIGRAHAGRVGRAARVVRIGSTLISLGVGIAAIVIVTTSILTDGAAVPVWLMILGGTMVAINSGAIGIGAAANHMKIGQYYDRQAEMHANNEAFRTILALESEPLPHGMREYWHHERPLFHMVSGRRLHDTNGVAGTTLSIVSGLASVGIAPISPDASIALFVASRSSSVLSATGAQGTNWHRLRAYRKILLRFGEDYHRLTAAHKPVIAAFTQGMLENVLDQIQLRKPSPYAGLLEFHLYKAIFSVASHHQLHSKLSPFNPDNFQHCLSAIINTLKPFLIEYRGKQQLSRNALRKIDQEHAYTIKPKHTFMDRQSVFDSLFVLEMVMRFAIMKTIIPKPDMADYEKLANDTIKTLNINTEHDVATKRLRFQIISALYEASCENISMTKEQLQQSISNTVTYYLAAEIKHVHNGRTWLGLRRTYTTVETDATFLDRDKLIEAYPVSAHAHGDSFHLNFHMDMLREAIRKELADRYMPQMETKLIPAKAPKTKKLVKRRVKKARKKNNKAKHSRLFKPNMSLSDSATNAPRKSSCILIKRHHGIVPE